MPDLDTDQERAGLMRQAWVGLAGILLLLIIPPMCLSAWMLTTFLSLLLVPPLIMFLLRWLEERVEPAILAGSAYFLLSAFWMTLGILEWADRLLWLDPFWLLQCTIGLAIGAGFILRYRLKWLYLSGTGVAILGLRVVMVNGSIPLISAILSAGVMLYMAYAASAPEIGFRRLKYAAFIALGMVILLIIPFPFGKPTVMKLTEGYKISRYRYSADPKRIHIQGKSVRPLMSALNDPDGLIRAEAVKHLGPVAQLYKEGDRDLNMIIDALIAKIDDDETRSDALIQLAAIGNPRAIKPLVGALEKYPDVENYPDRTIFKAFSGFAAQLMIERLEETTGSGWKDIRTRRRIIIALGNFRDHRVAGAIAKHLGDESRDVRQAAANSLRRMHSPDAVEALIPVLRDGNVRARRSAAQVLAKMRVGGGLKSELITALAGALTNEDASVRKYAAEALGNTRDERAVKPLVDVLRDEDRNVRRRAVRALGDVGGADAVEPLIAALEDEYIRQDAADALRKVGEPVGIDAAVEAMVEDLGHSVPGVRASAAEVLGRIESERAVAPLINALRDRDHRVREMAAYALGNIGSDQAMDDLIKVLDDEEPSVRRAAAKAIQQMGDPKGIALAVETMLKDLDDRNSDVRAFAAEALGSMDDRSVVPRLKHVAKTDRFDRVRRSAASALVLLTNVQIRYWAMIGPFDNQNRTGFEKQYPPEQEVDLSGVYDGKGGKIGWTAYQDGETSDLMPLFTPNQNAVMYALTYIASPGDTEAVFSIGSDDGVKVWLNDSLVWENDVYRALEIDADVFPVQLRKGMNKVLVKITQGDQKWGFHFRVTDDEEDPLDELEYLNPMRN